MELMFGPALLTARYTGVDTDGVAVAFTGIGQIMIRGLLIHVEGSTAVMHIRGKVAHDDDADAIITSDGVTVTLPIGQPNGQTLCTVKAPSGTKNISVIAYG